MTKNNFSSIVSDIENVKKTHNFYKTIGSEILALAENKLVIKIDNYEIHFIKDTSETRDKYIANLENPGNGIIYYIKAPDLEESLRLVKNAGRQIISGIKK